TTATTTPTTRPPKARSARELRARASVVPFPAVAGDEGVGFGGTPRAGFIFGQGAGRLAPVVEDGLREAPGLLDPVAARVERGVAVDGVQQQALVGLGRLAAED